MPRAERRALLVLAALTVLAPSARAQERGANAVGDAIAGLGTTMRVLVIAAHPDDEDTRLITWLAKGHRAEVAYLSLTRGDGGQNLIGNELGEALGVIRTEELLAARRVDGAHQYFTRAYDFGYSKTAAETFAHWPHDSLLKDVVTIVRAFRPQVIVAVFTGTPADGHGHHQVSALLAREAYDVAGDIVRFPRGATQGLAPWTVSKFYRGRSYFGPPFSYSYDAGEFNPLLGMSYTEIAAVSRSQHKSQGFGVLQRKGVSVGTLQREATRVNAAVDPSQETGLFDGIDTTRAASDSVAILLSALRRQFSPWEPERLAPQLIRMQLVSKCPDNVGDTLDAFVALFACRTARNAGAALLLAHGVAVEATVDRDVVAVGDSVPVVVTVYNRGREPITIGKYMWVRGSAVQPSPLVGARVGTLAADSVLRDTVMVRGVRPSQPWWLKHLRRGDLFADPVSSWPENAMGSPAEIGVPVEFGRADALVTVPVVHRYADRVKGEIDRPLAVAPAVSLTLDTQVEYVPANGAIERTVHVRLRSASAAARSVKVTLNLPKGLGADSTSRTVSLRALGAAAVDFRLRGTLAAGAHLLTAVAESGGQLYSTGYQAIEYDHIRPQTLYRDATVLLEAVDVAIPPGANIAYIPGVGDNVAPALQQLGIPVTMLDPAALDGADLAPYTAIVVGPRAYEAHPELVANNVRLLDWVKRGGTMVVQYGQYEMLQPGVMPYPITLARPAARVTEENAPVSVLAPEHPLLRAPNAIGASDWNGWVQDRGLYMPTTFDSAYTPLVAMHDTGEPANSGGLLVASYGRGTYVYATLAFFRQLPAGVPGAARLFVNLLGARQADAPRVTP